MTATAAQMTPAQRLNATGAQTDYTPSSFVAEAAARHRARVAIVDAERRVKFAELMPAIDLLKARCKAVVLFADNGRGDSFGKPGDTGGIEAGYVAQCLRENAQQQAAGIAEPRRASKPNEKAAPKGKLL